MSRDYVVEGLPVVEPSEAAPPRVTSSGSSVGGSSSGGGSADADNKKSPGKNDKDLRGSNLLRDPRQPVRGRKPRDPDEILPTLLKDRNLRDRAASTPTFGSGSSSRGEEKPPTGLAKAARLLRRAAAVCFPGCEVKEDSVQPRAHIEPPPPPPRQWFRIYPDGGTTQYIVRPDGAFRGRVPGAPKPDENLCSWRQEFFRDVPDVEAVKSHHQPFHRRRSHSVPPKLDVFQRLPLPFAGDAFVETCRICLDTPAEVITLPCRHAVHCEKCIRKLFFKRPEHKGGRNCILCRRRIHTVIEIEKNAAIPQYGYSIMCG
eukprot:TRINITY_DN44526_c0_g1_i2.p1 TRINITY_DN44526_c0_g1~~TRINITY_DN44526_c0_g1_i2.p1  ORF type:complete len:316 (-),score=58.23 TRINITY_DN44526_c0_g1_i2:161-1108(-)